MAKELTKSKLWFGVAFVLAAGLLIGFFIHSFTVPVAEKPFEDKSTDEQREEWIQESNVIRGDLASRGMYGCCLDQPCFYCIYKTPKHGEGATCRCAEEIMNGEHPCGECIGEIMEGHGLPSLAPYYATAIAEEVGEQHKDELKQIISEKYNITVEEQV